MDDTPCFSFCVITYIPDALKNETVNVGVVVTDDKTSIAKITDNFEFIDKVHDTDIGYLMKHHLQRHNFETMTRTIMYEKHITTRNGMNLRFGYPTPIMSPTMEKALYDVYNNQISVPDKEKNVCVKQENEPDKIEIIYKFLQRDNLEDVPKDILSLCPTLWEYIIAHAMKTGEFSSASKSNAMYWKTSLFCDHPEFAHVTDNVVTSVEFYDLLTSTARKTYENFSNHVADNSPVYAKKEYNKMKSLEHIFA